MPTSEFSRITVKYFQKYQEWRDKGIRAAQNQIKEGNDVLLVTLDIKRFFPSTYIDFKALKKDTDNEDQISLCDLLEIICINHTEKAPGEKRKNKLPMLPIGLVSSGVIANWFLADFDRELKEKMAPVYYGRYVDDIFIVVSNIKPTKEILKESADNNNGSNNKNITKTIEWIANRFFPEKRPLKIIKSEEGDCSLVFTDKKYHGLTIQGEKLKIFYFSPKWPLAMLNKFQKTLEENSSAFWFLPDEEEMAQTLDENAYDMYYEDTINKFRSISDIKASKYGASVFLAKRIKLAILKEVTPNDKITEEVFRFFKGVSLLALFNLWEKVFTYFVVTKDKQGIKRFHSEITAAIGEMTAKKNLEELKDGLKRHLDYSLTMAFSLSPSLINELAEDNREIFLKKEKLAGFVKSLRSSYLTRHHYLPLPSIVLTDFYAKTNHSLLGKSFLERILTKNYSLQLNEIANKKNSWLFPRWVYFNEICMLRFLMAITEQNKKDNVLFYKKTKLKTKVSENSKVFWEDSFIMESKDLYEGINNKSLDTVIEIRRHKAYRKNQEAVPKIQTHCIKINGDEKEDLELSIGLSNVKVEENEIKEALGGKPNTHPEKREKHIRLLNQAEEEKVKLLVLPETSVPLSWLFAYSDEARRKNRAFVLGLELFSKNKVCYNFSFALLPFKVGKMNDVLILPRLKNHYSPGETLEVLKEGNTIPQHQTSFYHLIKWKGIQFSIYNCFELADVVHRGIFRSELDVLFAIELNKDVNYFSNIAESCCRDLHCYFVQANTSKYGDSRVVVPRKTELMNPVRVKGGENDFILKYSLDIKKLREFQSIRQPYQVYEDNLFKTTPPDFDHEGVKNRGRSC